MNKAYLLIFTVLVVLMASCVKKSSAPDMPLVPKDTVAKVLPSQSLKDDSLIRNYIAVNNINAKKDTSGLYYQVLSPGSGANPTLASRITVTYTGTLLNGFVFDRKMTAISFQVTDLIKGWQIGIPFVKPGGRILLIVPSALGYGKVSPGPTIPANSVLIFDINLLAAQ